MTLWEVCNILPKNFKNPTILFDTLELLKRKLFLYILGDDEFQQWSIESFFDDPDKFIHEMNKTADLCKGQREHFILHTVLPHLEKSWGKCSSKNEEVFKILVQIGCSANSGVVIRHALLLFLHLICQEDFDSGNISLLVVEEITRSSIFMPDGVLKKSQHSETSLQAFVYSRILSWLLIQRARDVDLSFVAVEQDLKKIQHELEKSCNLVSGRKKDLYRYSMEFISKAISQFRSMPDTNLKTLIEECHKFCENSTLESGKLGILSKVKKNNCGEWVDLHCVLIHLHGKVGRSFTYSFHLAVLSYDKNILYIFRHAHRHITEVFSSLSLLH